MMRRTGKNSTKVLETLNLSRRKIKVCSTKVLFLISAWYGIPYTRLLARKSRGGLIQQGRKGSPVFISLRSLSV